MNVNRREALRRLPYYAVLLAGAGTPWLLSRAMMPPVHANPVQHLRPPGALPDDADFVRACVGCGLCGEVCPPKCIQFHRRDGGAQANTPFINPEVKACTLCGKCMEVCPTDALRVTERTAVDMGVAQIDRTACYPWVDKGICGACVSICPLGERAIRFEMFNQYRPVIQPGCVGCGLCVEVCPHPSLPIWIVERSKETVARYKAV